MPEYGEHRPPSDQFIPSEYGIDALFEPDVEAQLGDRLYPYQLAAFSELRDILSRGEHLTAVPTIVGLSGSGKSFLIEQVNEAIAQQAPDSPLKFTSQDSVEFSNLSVESRKRVRSPSANIKVITSTPAGFYLLNNKVHSVRPVEFNVAERLQPEVDANILEDFEGNLPLSSLPDVPDLRSAADLFARTADREALRELVADYFTYNFTTGYRHSRFDWPQDVPESVQKIIGSERHTSAVDRLGGINRIIDQHNARNPDAQINRIRLSAGSAMVLNEVMKTETYNGAPGAKVFAPNLTNEQAELLRSQLFPNQTTSFEGGRLEPEGLLEILDSRKICYTLKYDKSRFALTYIDQTVEDRDFGTDYEPFDSYFVMSVSDHGPSSFAITIVREVIAVEAVLQSAGVPYEVSLDTLGKDRDGNWMENVRYQVDANGNVEVDSSRDEEG